MIESGERALLALPREPDVPFASHDAIVATPIARTQLIGDYCAAAIAAIWAGVRKLSEPMPPVFLLMAFWMFVADEPSFDVPWQPAQY